VKPKTSQAIQRLVDKTKGGSMGRVKGLRHDISTRILIAGRILEIYGNGGGYKDVLKEFGAPPVDPKTRRPMNRERLLAWAAEAFMSDEAKQIGAARIAKEFEDIVAGRVTDIAEWDENGVKLKSSANLNSKQLAAVASIEEGEHGMKIRMVDRIKALGHLKDIYIGNTVKVEGEIKHTHRLAERLDQAIKQVAGPVVDVTPTQEGDDT